MRTKTKEILRYTSAAACLILYVFCYTLYEQTIVVWWRPLIIAAIPVVLTAPLVAGRWTGFTGSRNRTLNLLCHLYFGSAVCLFAFLGGNRFAADGSVVHKERFTVTEKISVERTKYRRSGRRIIRAESYTVYYLRLRSENGQKKKIPVSLSQYNRVRTDGILTLPLYEGRFGYPVIEQAGQRN